MNIGDLVAHKLYVHSRGVLVDINENNPLQYTIYYVNKDKREQFRSEKKDEFVFIKVCPEPFKKLILQRYELEKEAQVLSMKKASLLDQIVQDLNTLHRV